MRLKRRYAERFCGCYQFIVADSSVIAQPSSSGLNIAGHPDDSRQQRLAPVHTLSTDDSYWRATILSFRLLNTS
jgi:hypothetical protein